MAKTKIIFFAAFALAVGAGVAVGMLGSRSLPRHDLGGGRSWMVQELQLTPEQERQMREIWTEMMRTRGVQFGMEFQSLEREREMAIAGLLSDDQRSEYERVNRDFMERAGRLWKRAEEDFVATVERSRAILSESQRPRFDALMERFRSQHGRGGWPGLPAQGQPSAGGTTPGASSVGPGAGSRWSRFPTTLPATNHTD